MLAIKKQEQAAYEALMNDPVRRRLLLKAAGQDNKTREHKHRKHHHDDERDGSSRRHRHHKRRRTDDFGDNDRPYRSRHSDSFSRSPSPRRQSNDRPSYGRYSRYHRSRRSESSSRSTSPSRRRSPPPSVDHRRSPLPRDRRRSRSPQRSKPNGPHLRQSRSWHNPSQRDGPSEDDRAARLAEMQQAASSLEGDRDQRLAAIKEKEFAELAEEEEARARSSKYGGKGDFVHGLNRKAGDISIGERMRRGQKGLERDRDEE